MLRGAQDHHVVVDWSQDQSPRIGVVGVCDECRIVAEADHRIANQLAMLAAFVRLKAVELDQQATDPDRQEIQTLLVNVRAQIDAIARLQRAFAIGGDREPVDLGEHLHAVCAGLVATLSSTTELTEDHHPDCRVRPDQILPLTQIVAEVIINAVKYARPLGEPGMILVRSRSDRDGAVVIEVIDDGPGLPVDVDLLTGGGLGFRLLRALSDQLGARVEFVSGGGGLRFRITLPRKGIGSNSMQSL